MDNAIIIGLILIGSVILGWIKYGQVLSRYDFDKDTKNLAKNAPWQWKFAELWNCSSNFFIGGLVVYYFCLIRWSLLVEGNSLSFGDFALLIIFMMSLFGHLSVLSLNITKGVEVILKRLLDR